MVFESYEKLLVILFLFTTTLLNAKELTATQKFDQLVTWSNTRPVIRMKGDQFKQYVRGTHKSYSVILMLTALSPKRQCAICQKANEEFNIVANSWRYSATKGANVFFVLVDFDDAPDVFQMLNQQSAPVFMYFSGKSTGKKPYETLDIQKFGISADAIGRFVGERAGVHIRILRPPDYSATFALVLLGLTVAAFVYIKRDSLEYIYNTTFWSLFVLVVILAMLSGQMWNQIRGPPFSHRDPQTGQTHFFNGHSQAQFIAETYIVFILYAAAGGGIILLNEANIICAGDHSNRKIMVLVGVATFAFFFSVLLSIFRAKYQGYPYSFLLS